MIKNKKFFVNKKAVELSIKAIVRLIIALAVLFLVVFPACNKLRSYFFGQDEIPVDEKGIPIALGQPDANGIYTYDVPGWTTPIWYSYIDGAWQWTPYRPPTDIWMPVTTTVVSEGGWKGQEPVEENIKLIKYLAEKKPTP